MATDREHVEVAGREVTRKGGGILWYVDSIDGSIWFPLSQVEVSSDGTSLLVPRWLADEKEVE
jgi:hypothetical protein